MSKTYRVLKDSYCEAYLHEKLHYPRPGLIEKKLTKDEIVELIDVWNNFYGTFYRVKKNDVWYDMLPENLKEVVV